MKSVVELVTKILRLPRPYVTKLNRSFKSLPAVFHRAGFSTRTTFRRQRQQVKQVSASTTSAPVSGTTLQMKPVNFSAHLHFGAGGRVNKQATLIQTCLNKAGDGCVCTDRKPHSKRIRNTGQGTDACTQTMIRRQGSTFQTRLKHRVETMLVSNKDHNPACLV